jgi:hypothetical protein
VRGAERQRVDSFGQLADGFRVGGPWYRWGPYLSERQWGTVREDYSADGGAWGATPHDHARSKAYRWGEEGMAGFSDIGQRVCVALALWNGRDPILKERMFGLTGPQGNHGEDVKEYWWFLDAVPSHAWNRWRYHYPRRAFPYEDLVVENGRRTKHDPEYELLDTGAFDDGTWVVEVDWAKAGADDLLMVVRVTNDSPEADVLDVLPTLWCRDTWTVGGAPRPSVTATGPTSMAVRHPELDEMELLVGPGPDGTAPELVFCENETNVARLYGAEPTTPFPKDGINDHVVDGATTVNPERTGTKAAARYRLDVAPHATVEIRVRLRPRAADGTGGAPPPATSPTATAPVEGTADPLGADFTAVHAARLAEADEFYAELRPAGASDDEARVMRQAFAGMLWSKQLYYYDVGEWLDGDPGQPTPPAARLAGRNAAWRSFNAFDIMSMPDPWEYPWFAAWDLAFHAVTIAHLDPAFAKYQLLVLCREWFQHPNGALPAYEWDFGDVNPPVQAWAALEVFAIDGCRDTGFLGRILDKLVANFTWWVNRQDPDGNNAFSGGFLGLDNIGPLDRSHLPEGVRLEQSDAAGWMAFYALSLAAISMVLTASGARDATDLAIKFLEHFATIRAELDARSWDPDDGLFVDQLVLADGTSVPMKVRSMVGVIPLLATASVNQAMLRRAHLLGKRSSTMLVDALGGLAHLRETGQLDASVSGTLGHTLDGGPGDGGVDAQLLLLSAIDPSRLRALLGVLFDESEFLSPHGLRALSAVYREVPYEVDVGGRSSTIDYEPAESTTDMFGGNSNWRGPVWFPLNYLVVSALDRYHRFFGDAYRVEYPTGSGELHDLGWIADDLRHRLVGLFVRGEDGRRPIYGGTGTLQDDPAWRDNITFNEYFHGDNGAGLGASHQTGWTGLVADLIRGRPSEEGVYHVSEVGRVVMGARAPDGGR